MSGGLHSQGQHLELMVTRVSLCLDILETVREQRMQRLRGERCSHCHLLSALVPGTFVWPIPHVTLVMTMSQLPLSAGLGAGDLTFVISRHCEPVLREWTWAQFLQQGC